LERQSKSLAEVIRAQEEESDRLSDGVVKEAITLSNLGLSISEAEAKLESLVAQIGAANRMEKSSEFGSATHEAFERSLMEGGSLVSEDEFAGVIEKGMMANSGLKGTP